jgi:ABC-type siderophore export system fused ATPase/permease subunit
MDRFQKNSSAEQQKRRASFYSRQAAQSEASEVTEKMADEAIITWSFANWVTVILMAAIGFGLLGLGMKFYQKNQAAA